MVIWECARVQITRHHMKPGRPHGIHWINSDHPNWPARIKYNIAAHSILPHFVYRARGQLLYVTIYSVLFIIIYSLWCYAHMRWFERINVSKHNKQQTTTILFFFFLLSTTQSLHMERSFGKIKLILFRSDVHLGDLSRVCVSVFFF